MSVPDTTQSDPLNTVLLDARKNLQEIQSSLRQANVNISDVLSHLYEATTKYQNEAEDMINERRSASTMLPIQVSVKPAGIIQKIRAIAPHEKLPFKTNKAWELKKLTVRPVSQQIRNKVIPPLKNFDPKMSALELLEKGKITDNDNISSILPPVEPANANASAPFFSNLKIDIPGAARVYQMKRAENQRSVAEYNEAIEREKTSKTPIRVTTPKNQGIGDEAEIQQNENDPKKNPAPRVYEVLQDEYAYQTLLVVRGKIARDTPDFESFQRTNSDVWEKITQVLDAIENFCAMFDIQFAEINGRKLSEASKLHIITFDDVHQCLVNVDEFVNKKQNEAANVIQKNARIFLHKLEINRRKLEARSAFMIQRAWRNYKRNSSLIERNDQRNQDIIGRANFLTEEFKENSMKELSSSEVVEIHVLASLQEIGRTFSLIYRNVTIIVIMADLPPAHVWEEMVDFFAMCGIPNVNERIHFISLREMSSGVGVSHRLQCDLKSITKIRRILQGRLAYIVPHSDWFSEQRLSVDLQLPIFGLVDTTLYQSRGSIKKLFNEAEISTPISTSENKNIRQLLVDGINIIERHPNITRYIIRYGFSQNEKSIAFFNVTKELLDKIKLLTKRKRGNRSKPASSRTPKEKSTNSSNFEVNEENSEQVDENNPMEEEYVDINDPLYDEIIRILKKEIKCNGCSLNTFFSIIEEFGGIIEAVPPVIRSFPSVVYLLSGDKKIKVIGTYDRLHYAPFKFAGNLVPQVSVDNLELISKGKQVASVLLKHGIMGYATIDFLAFDIGNGVQLSGFDIRTNSYPISIYTTYLTLCAGFNESNGKVALLRNVGDPHEDAQRYTIIQPNVTHPGMATIGMGDIKKACFSEGLFFDLLNRIGFRLMFFDSPSKGKSFALNSARTPQTAISLMIKYYTFLMKFFGVKAGNNCDSSIASGVIALKDFKKRIYPN